MVINKILSVLFLFIVFNGFGQKLQELNIKDEKVKERVLDRVRLLGSYISENS